MTERQKQTTGDEMPHPPASAPLLLQNPERRRIRSDGDSQLASSAKQGESWTSSEVMHSPLRWLESWSTNAPSLLCQNCHDTINFDTVDMGRRFTLA